MNKLLLCGNAILIFRYILFTIIQNFVSQIPEASIFFKLYRKFMGYDCVIAYYHITYCIYR